MFNKKKIRTLLLTAMATLGATVGAFADDAAEVTRLTVTLASGEQEHFDFPDNPQVTFPDTHMKVTTDLTETTYDRTEVSGYSFSKGPRQVSLKSAGVIDYTFRYTGTKVTITGQNITSADVYTTTGIRIMSSITASDGIITIEFGNLPSGTYIVAPAGHTPVKIKN
ncbi:MAG: hypothetical protein K2H33_06505 [Muribaculaceae bacterium]|nr:hypothetical protein [Muribaculaceae bacterium]MDE6119346.1 hypothetical protein [Muribaculaceae bacterium]